MSAPTRIVYGDRNAYALDPYTREAPGVVDDLGRPAGGRFTRKPTMPLPPLELLEASAQRVELIDLSNGNGAAFTTAEGRNAWRVRVVREGDGAFRVEYLEP